MIVVVEQQKTDESGHTGCVIPRYQYVPTHPMN